MAQPLEAYYERGTGQFWTKDKAGAWIPLNSGDYMLRLKARGYKMHAKGGSSESEEEKIRVQDELNINYAGTLAGYDKGLIIQDGNRILVTEGPKMIEPAPVGWPTINQFLLNLLGEEQMRYFLSWLHVAIDSLKTGSHRFGQAICIAGPPRCGKSFLQNKIITPMLGGRSAKPYRYMMGKTAFNADLFSAEHLIIEDEAANSDLRVRREFGSRIKEIVVNEVQSCHGKYQEAVSLHPFWRLTMSVNDEPENLMILPPFEDSLGEKIHLYRARPNAIPIDTTATNDYMRFGELVRMELPGLMWDMLDWHGVPADIADTRFGVTFYHDPTLKEMFEQNNPEIALMEIIDKVVFDGTGSPQWEGTGRELEQHLMIGGFDHQVRKLLAFNNAIGTYLGRLSKTHSSRVKPIRTKNGGRTWQLINKDHTQVETTDLSANGSA